MGHEPRIEVRFQIGNLAPDLDKRDTVAIRRCILFKETGRGADVLRCLGAAHSLSGEIELIVISPGGFDLHLYAFKWNGMTPCV